MTDYSNASRTMLLDLRTLDWADDLLEVFGIDRSLLPSLCPSSGVVATADAEWFGAPVPIAGMAGDQQAALFGQGAFRAGDCKNTYGTGCFLLMNVGDTPAPPRQGLLSTIAWVLSDRSRPVYALEGSVFMGGGAAQWLCEALGIMTTPADIGPLAAQAPDNGGVYFVPALTGLGAPYWDPYARGLLIGLTRGTGPAHLARATEEAICLQTRAVLEAMQSASGAKVAHAPGRRWRRCRRLSAAATGRSAGGAGQATARPRVHGTRSGRTGRLGSRLLDRDGGGRTGGRRQGLPARHGTGRARPALLGVAARGRALPGLGAAS